MPTSTAALTHCTEQQCHSLLGTFSSQGFSKQLEGSNGDALHTGSIFGLAASAAASGAGGGTITGTKGEDGNASCWAMGAGHFKTVSGEPWAALGLDFT